MKINILTPKGGKSSGGNRITADYAKFLMAQGHEVVVYAVYYGNRTQRILDRFFFTRRFELTSISNFVPDAPRERRFDGVRKIRPQDIEDGDIVISTWWETAEWMKQLPPRKGEQVHFVQDHEVFPYLPQERSRAVYAEGNHKLAASSWLKAVLKDEYGIGSTLVLNGVDTDRFHPAHGKADRDLVIGFMFSAKQRKNVDRAIIAIRQAKRSVPDLRVVCFGAPARPDVLPDWVEYERSPPQDRIVEIYAQCHAWLFTSDSEGFGLPILEAMACGTPVLATRAGAAPDLVVDGVNGRLLPFDAEAFCTAIVELADMPAARHADWSAAARRTAEDNDLSVARRRFEQALQDIVDGSRPT